MVTARFTDHVYSPHWHDSYTVSAIEYGAERYDYRGARFVAEAGSLPIISPGEIHTGSSGAEAGWQCRTFYLPIEFLQDLAVDAGFPNDIVPWFGKDVIRDPDLVNRMLLAHRLLEDGRDNFAAEYALLDAISTLLRRHAQIPPPAGRAGADQARVERMKARMLDDIGSPISLSELAEAVGLSKFYAARLFTREVGIAPHAWRNQMRILRAQDAMRAGMSAAEVATASGFTDQSHFSRLFKKTHGVSPGRWGACT